MIAYELAIEKILSQATMLGEQLMSIADSFGFVAAQDVICDCLISPFDNSAMDGFAVRHQDLQNGMVEMDVVGSSFAGDEISHGTGGAWEIMTGAGIPDGFDTVIKIEYVTIVNTDNNGRPEQIKINQPDAPLGNNIRKAGQDFSHGDLVIAAGQKINAAHIAALATIGVAEILVRKKPTIAVISTGKEIVDDANIPLQSGQIRNSNGPYLLATLQDMGFDASYAGTIKDEIEDYEACLNRLIGEYDIIISTGAVSMGRHDFIPESLGKLGADILFHKCKIRPGKPILFAKFKTQKTYYFGLPGNPISASVGLRFFVSGLIDALQGLAQEQPIKAKLTKNNIKDHGFKMFNKAFATFDDGTLNVDILQGQESFKIKPLLTANCWAVFDEDQHETKTDALVNIYPMSAGGKL
ncbi:MAG: molybdopterin molybdotransferase MoeA [Alphaproteobacteria bacterium]|nr:molybdopterin molybdotransferase MoeA [Alphaproteobacteria bacterium]